jgi:hypothetical protein
MHYYLYEIKNTVNGKIYVGVHKTKSLDDGYMGSGKVVSNAIRKYGIKHFTKTILETFDNSADMFAKEKEVVNDEFLARTDVYNLRRGGTGGFDYVNRVMSIEQRRSAGAAAIRSRRENELANPQQKINRINKLRTLAMKHGSSGFSDESRQKGLAAMQTAEAMTKRKATYAQHKHQSGNQNSQFGTCWIHCEFISKSIKIKSELIPYYLDQGWSKGRKLYASIAQLVEHRLDKA